MPGYLLFDLLAPMASWGTENKGQDIFWGQALPTKSAIIGMIGACLGVDYAERDELYRMSSRIKMASLTLCEGTRVIDLHTAQAGGIEGAERVSTRREELARMEKNSRTIMTKRLYYSSQLHVIAISGDDGDLERISAGLEEPFYTPCAGRKSCLVGLPFSPRVEVSGCAMTMMKARATSLRGQKALSHLNIGPRAPLSFESGFGGADFAANMSITRGIVRDSIAPHQGHFSRNVLTTMLNLES